jgi:hypothetical protein
MSLERRRSPRTPLEKPASINLAPNNGGLMSDISVGGLGFHGFAPVPKTGTIRFSFSLEPNRPIEAFGELVWADETKRKGGLRFTWLPAEAYQQIWVHQAPTALTAGTARISSERSSHTPSTVPALLSNRSCPNCGKPKVQRSRRHGFVERRLLRLLHLSPYRCMDCNRRFYGMN